MVGQKYSCFVKTGCKDSVFMLKKQIFGQKNCFFLKNTLYLQRIFNIHFTILSL